MNLSRHRNSLNFILESRKIKVAQLCSCSARVNSFYSVRAVKTSLYCVVDARVIETRGRAHAFFFLFRRREFFFLVLSRFYRISNFPGHSSFFFLRFVLFLISIKLMVKTRTDTPITYTYGYNHFLLNRTKRRVQYLFFGKKVFGRTRNNGNARPEHFASAS